MCWVSRAEISSLFIGENNFSQYWEGANKELLELMSYANVMETQIFDFFARDLVSDIYSDNRERFQFYSEAISSLNMQPFESCFAPSQVNIHVFAHHYYLSIARSLRAFREEHRLSQEYLATVVGLPLSTYQRIEHLSVPTKCISMYTAARFIMAFKIPSSVNFLSKMDYYKEAGVVRSVQQKRDQILYDLLINESSERVRKWRVLAERLVKYDQARYSARL